MKKRKNILTKKNFWIITINSTAAYVIAALMIFYINHFTTIFTAGMYDYSLSFNYEKIFYHIEPYQWTNDAVKLMYSAGPLLIFIFGIISLVAFYFLLEEHARIKIFFLWFSFLSFNYFFGGMLIGNLFTKGIGHVFNWMYFNSTEKMVVALIGFFGLIGTAFLMVRPIAISVNSYYNEFNEKIFPFFFTSQIILPYMIGTILIELYFLPEPDFNIMWFWVTMIVLLFIAYMMLNNMENLYFDEDEREISISKILLLVFILLFFGLRILLSREIYINW
jgi:hypothetical protein